MTNSPLTASANAVPNVSVPPSPALAPQPSVSETPPGFDVQMEAGVPERIDQRLVELNSLLARLEQSAAGSAVGGRGRRSGRKPAGASPPGNGQQLVPGAARKHAPTAGHSLRVALASSAWATALEVPNAERDAIEVAALLHDIGKIGVPDKVLLKPGPLTGEEMVLMERYRALTLEILTACCASPMVLNIVRHAIAWYDGSRSQGGPARDQIPAGLAVDRHHGCVRRDDVQRSLPAAADARTGGPRTVQLRRHAVRPAHGPLLQRIAGARSGAAAPPDGGPVAAGARPGKFRQCVAAHERSRGPGHGRYGSPVPTASCWTTCTTPWCSSTTIFASNFGTAARNG